ncbi:MAG: prepilin-type N-terminal cleavage/methylation domain-containing protein [Gammaproteobacteria bacterium]|nr:prepilin-type N-terminal cleavage/methylation domain-containing protein [Gammaproteobacteria bacterium]NNE04575.1 prepilin-type N-terminal cleavage/methylation domain-containing protein [Xanthomonadales bacterium]
MIRIHSTQRQRGVSLLEMMIAMAISLIVSLAMVLLMSNTLSTGTDTIGMARLGTDLRAALQIMTRDVRRANYHGNYAKCFGNWQCRTTLDNGSGDTSAYIKAITVGTSQAAGDCFFYWFDRDSDGDVTDDDDAGAFRRTVVGGRGVLQMTTTRNTTPSCNSGNYWVDITDSDLIDVTAFTVSRTNDPLNLSTTTNELSFVDTVINGAVNQNVEKVAISITGQLVRNNQITRTVNDIIRVRNDFYTAAP